MEEESRILGRRMIVALPWLWLLVSILVGFAANAMAESGDRVFYEDFEGNLDDWWTDRGVWQIGIPTVGPLGGPPGTPDPNNCSGTVLDGYYPPNTDSRLISPSIEMPPLEGEEHLELRFWMWYSYNTGDQGEVQVSTDGGNSWSNALVKPVWESTYSSWSRVCVNLTGYAGQRIRIAFCHTATNADRFMPDEASGWYIDEVEVWRRVPCVAWPEGFEDGWRDWCTDHGVWQIGQPMLGPDRAYRSVAVAGTDLSDYYPRDTDSRLISPAIRLPSVGAGESVLLCFWEWYSYNSGDYGQVQISTWDGSKWGQWSTVETPAPEESNSDWSRVCVILTEHAGQQIRIAFYHTATNADKFRPDEASGWYIDQIQILPHRNSRIDVPLESEPETIPYFQVVTRTGTLTAETEAGSGDFQPLAGRIVRVVFTPRFGQAQAVEGFDTTDSLGNFEVTVRLREVGIWDAKAEFNCSFGAVIASSRKDYDQPIEVITATAVLTLNVESKRLRIGQSTRIWGTLSTDQVGLRVSDARIMLNIRGPSTQGEGQTLETTTNEQGQYTFDNFPRDFPDLNPVPFSEPGEWILQAKFESDVLQTGQSSVQRVDVLEGSGCVIIITGKSRSGEGIEHHSFSTNNIYRAFIARGFARDRIMYLNFDTDQADNCDPARRGNSDIIMGDLDEDGNPDQPTKANIERAIKVWAKQKVEQLPGPLYIVATDHGLIGNPERGKSAGLILDKEVLRGDDLAAWLDEFDNSLRSTDEQTRVPEVIIYGACYSGGFIPPLSKMGRIVITSAAEGERSYKGPSLSYPGCVDVRDGEFFLGELFKRISDGMTILDSFRLATGATEAYTASEDQRSEGNDISGFLDTAAQHPLLDDNGDGRGTNLISNLIPINDSGDGLNSHFAVGEGFPVSSVAGKAATAIMLEVVEICGDRFLSPGSELSFRDYDDNVVPEQYLWERTNDPTLVDTAFIEIKPPGSVPQESKSETVQLERYVYKLESDRLNDSTYIWMNLRRNDDLDEKFFDGFSAPGAYEIAYYLQDAETGKVTTPIISRVYRDREGNEPPRAFNLEKPVDGAQRVSRSPVFDWEDAIDPDEKVEDGSITYTLIITPEPGARPEAKEIVISGIKSSSYSFDTDPEDQSPLVDSTYYVWKVIAIDPFGGRTRCNRPFSFKTDEPNGARGWLRVEVVKFGSEDLVPRCWIQVIGPDNLEEILERGVFRKMLSQGAYNLKLRAPGYDKKGKSVVVDAYEEKDVSVPLSPAEKPTRVLKAYLCVERFGLALKDGVKDKLQIRGRINVRRPEMSIFPSEDELFDFDRGSLVVEINDFRRIIPSGALTENPPLSGRYAYKDKATGITLKLRLYAQVNGSKGTFAISVVSSLTEKVDPASEEIKIRLRNGVIDTEDPLVMSETFFDQTSVFQPEQKGQSARFGLGKTGKLIQPLLCISRASISGRSRVGDPLSLAKFSIRGWFATGGDNALDLSKGIHLQVVENGFEDTVDEKGLLEKKGRYTYKAKREGITSVLIDRENGTFRISGSKADMRNADGNPVEMVFDIGNDDKRETNVDMVKTGKRWVY